MWDLLKQNEEDCRKLRDSLEEVAARHGDAVGVEEGMESLPEAERKHMLACEDCRQAAQDLVATRKLFEGAARFAETDRPWFAAQVMAAIAARERELVKRLSAWSEFPRFASRLAWISAVLLLAGTTWIYERGMRALGNSSNGGAQESIFEAPQPSNQDEALISMAESNP
jgi:hypothetical protein